MKPLQNTPRHSVESRHDESSGGGAMKHGIRSIDGIRSRNLQTKTPSFRRKPESRVSEHHLDPGVRRDDGSSGGGAMKHGIRSIEGIRSRNLQTKTPSFRRKPESRVSEHCRDPGVRRHDESSGGGAMKHGIRSIECIRSRNLQTKTPSFRRKPESRVSEHCRDPGVRRDDGSSNAATRNLDSVASTETLR